MKNENGCQSLNMKYNTNTSDYAFLKENAAPTILAPFLNMF